MDVPVTHTARLVVAAPDGDRPVLIRYRTGDEEPYVETLARRLGGPPGSGLNIDGRRVAAPLPLSASGLADGSRVEANTIPRAGDPAAPWRLWVVGGPGTGRRWPLPVGVSHIGPGMTADVRLTDVSPDAAATIRVTVNGSTTIVDGSGSRTVGPGDPWRLGERLLTVTPPRQALARPRSGPVIPFRARPEPPPRLPPAPDPPSDPPNPAGPTPFSWIGVAAPLAMGALVAVLWSPRFALFAALGPVISVGGWLEQRRRHRRDVRAHTAEVGRRTADHADDLRRHRAGRAAIRRQHLVAVPELCDRARSGGSQLWARDDLLVLSIGWDGDEPVALDLLGRSTAVCGPPPMAAGLVRHLVVQAAAGHSPSALSIECAPELGDGPDGEHSWIRWLPHGAMAAGTARLAASGPGRPPVEPPDPLTAQLFVLSETEDPPPWVDTLIIVTDRAAATVEERAGGSAHGSGRSITTAPLSRDVAAAVARPLARWQDVTAGPTGSATRAVIRLDEIVGVVDDPGALLDRWSRSGRDEARSLPVTIGLSEDRRFVVDLVADGPHAVIGGTTGSGKSELLRTLVAALCATRPPDDVTFVLVDYKGGSAFDGCSGLPHVTTVVTDLDGTRTERVLTAVDAELTRRERWLRAHGRPDISAAEDVQGRPPRLVVVIDEFATLARDQPGFLPALVDIARRGRSLGLHLVLATQRPAGAMTDDIRANTDLRVALRMVDAADSIDVVGVPDAASLPADRPGWAVVQRAGATVQICRVAVSTSPGVREPALEVRGLDDPAPQTLRPAGEAGPTQLERLVEATQQAIARSGREAAGPLWPPELPRELDPDDPIVPSCGPPADGHVTIGLADDLTATTHRPCRWSPAGGLLSLHGAHGSGLAAVLTGLVAILHGQSGPIHVYAVDGTDELAGWQEADPVAAVVRSTDRDGLRRLLARLDREDDAPRPAAGQATRVLVVHDHPATVRALDDLDGLRLLDRLHALAVRGPRRGVAVCVTSPRPGDLPSSIAGAVGRRLLLRVAQSDDYRLVGLRPPVVPLPQGRGLDEEGTLVQLVRCDPSSLPSRTRTGPSDRPSPLVALPTTVAVPPDPPGADDPWQPTVGVDQDGPARLTLEAGSAAVIAGPPGSGRTTALRVIAAQVGSRGVSVVHVVDRSADRRRSEGIGTVATAADLPARLEDVTALGLLVVIDDATEVEDPSGTLHDLIRGRARPDRIRLVVAVDPVERRTAYGHWSSALRRSRYGIALHHDPEDDADLWARRLTPAPRGRRPTGRGLLMADDRDPVEIQVARP